jgi:DNA end-binding protein Ku
MARATWSGNFRLGELVFPVKLFSAIKPAGPEFSQVHKSDLAPIKRQTVCSLDGKLLNADDITRAVMHEGTYIEVSNVEEIKANIERDIIVRQFAESNRIHSLYYDKPYYIVPDFGGQAAYVILRNALKKANKIAVVTYALYGNAHLGVIGPTDGMMILQQLKYATELVERHDIQMPSLPQPSPQQLDLAVSLIEKYSTEFYLDDYRNEQTDLLIDMVERSRKGLRPKKQKKIPSDITSEKDLTNTFRDLLGSKEKQLG